jgi:ABC-2 type transport system ATP-binding protein
LIVQTHSLTKQYAKVTALDHCDLTVEAGEVFGLLGPNGAGKTTLLRLLLGYLRPTHGTATIDGLDCYRESVEVHRRVSYLPGDVRLFGSMRGRDVLDFFSSVRTDTDKRRAAELADRLELDLTRRVAFMSTGMRQKLGLAITLAADTPIMVLDEPTANLDPSVRADVMRLVGEAQARGRTVLFSSHVLSEVEEVCDRVVVLRKGRLVHTQGMEELRRKHRIRAKLPGQLPPPPDHLSESIASPDREDGYWLIEAPGELTELLGWLATLPLEDLQIEPLGLKSVYAKYHEGNGH